jgi:hypothetical protein
MIITSNWINQQLFTHCCIYLIELQKAVQHRVSGKGGKTFQVVEDFGYQEFIAEIGKNRYIKE